MKYFGTKFEGLVLMAPEVYKDSRGSFFESYIKKHLATMEIPDFVQENESCSSRGVLRGLHFQKAPFSQGKLVRVVKGRALDSVVDLRENSPTFKQWYSADLSGENKNMLYVPPGFAHGFLALEEDTIFQYKCTQNWNKEAESGIRWDDSTLDIDWKLGENGLTSKDLIISEKDASLLSLEEYLETLAVVN